MITKDDENMMIVPLYWLTRDYRKAFIREGYEAIPIPRYKETIGYNAYKIIGPYTDNIRWIRELSIPIWEDWKLTAKYADDIEIDNSTNGPQMFDHLDDDEKIKALRYYWYPVTTDHIITYFEDRPELLERARRSLNQKDISTYFKDLF